MGLDLIVEGRAKPGYEQEWRQLLERSFKEEELSSADASRFKEISIPGYERIGAPRVGYDSAANEWILEARKPTSSEERAAVLKEFEGYYVVRLVKCDGVPEYSNGGAYDGADETSFRGSFLNDCEDVLGKALLEDAWNHKFPNEAVEYGKALLATADSAERGDQNSKRVSLLSRFGLRKKRESVPLVNQLEIVRAAGRWYVFWGERGHAIRAWF